jgi:hypothetical protein
MFYIIIFTIIIVFLCFDKKIKRENFEYCSNCKKNNFLDCFNCNNCGICVDRIGRRNCEPGDANGPYNRSDCLYWMHNGKNSYSLI